jgi:hypothetical protein
MIAPYVGNDGISKVELLKENKKKRQHERKKKERTEPSHPRLRKADKGSESHA